MCGSCATGRWIAFVGSVQTAVREAVAEVLEVAKSEDRSGGYFCLKILSSGDFTIKPILIGEVTNGKDDKYIEFCQEKANRLETEHAANGHVSSWQSRDPENGKWGGAIIGSDNQGRQYAFSFSGLPELCDEAVTLLTAIKVGYLSEEEARKIAEISGSDDILVECYDFDGWQSVGNER